MDIIILGPTACGKTDFANYLASIYSLPVLNIDSVQAYKGLNEASNKPKFSCQKILEGEVVSFTKSNFNIDYQKYRGFNFWLHIDVDGCDKFSGSISNMNEILDNISSTLKKKSNENKEYVENFLFDVREIQTQYNVRDLIEDIYRIAEKKRYNSKILCGGTIYYAYHYVLGTNFESYDYIKPINKISNFILLVVQPNDRVQYYKYLDSIVYSRLNFKVFEEIKTLTQDFNDKEKIEWLSKISYEYKYLIKIAQNIDNVSVVDSFLDELRFKEHKYAKRQITFMRKLQKDLLSAY